jgi:hypothetical protein
MPPDVRPAVNHPVDAPEDEKALTELVAACALSFEQGIGQDFKENCERYYRQYRGFRKFRDAWVKSGPNDKDGILYDAKKHWGAALHIPLSFRTIETMVPRAIAHRPRMLYLPRKEEFAENVQNVRLLIDAQQDQIDIDLPFQAVMRSGRMYGLGVGKCYWRKEYATRRRIKPRIFRPGEFKVGSLQQECVFDDPMFEDVDIFDFMWDQYGSDARTCGYLLHRCWLSLDMCLQRVRSGAWNTVSAQALTEDKLRGMGSRQKYDEIWQQRMEASGFSSFQTMGSMRGEQIHELLEWHDGERVLSVLDRCVTVQDAENQCVGTKPFQTYRPTPLQRQMVGIGDLEPLEHLQRELDTLRSQRRDAATIALCAGYAYDDGMIEEDDLVFGPAAAIRVTNGRPSDALMPLPVRDVPGSGYQEEQVIRQDFDAVSGVTDALDPSRGTTGSGTATEAQLVQASLSARIELGSRRFEVEVVRHAARCFLHLDQRMIVKPRDPIRLPDEGYDEQQAAEEGRWQWFPVGPGELQGEYEIIPEGGSMAARNIPQDRQDAQIFLSLSQNPLLDQRRPLVKALELLGVSDTEAWLKHSEAPVPPKALELLQQAGVDPRLIQQAVMVAQRQDPSIPTEQQGPGVQQVDAAMNGAPA